MCVFFYILYYNVPLYFLSSEYNSDTNSHDIALIITDVPIVFSDTVRPACLPEHPVDEEGVCVISGWGNIAGNRITNILNTKCLRKEQMSSLDSLDSHADGEAQPSELHMVEIPIIPHTICSDIYGTLDSSMLCAGDVMHGGIDSCQVYSIMISTPYKSIHLCVT